MSDEFIKAKHEKFNAPESLVFELVQKSTSEKPISRTKIIQGNDNEVYKVATRAGKNFYVRIKHFGSVSLTQEAWAMGQCRDAGVPVPEVFLINKITLPEGEREVMVASEAAGKPLDILERELSLDDWRKVTENAGRTLRKIHSVKVDGFYHRHNDGSWDIPSWERLMELAGKDRAAERSLLKSVGFNDNEFDFMLKMLAAYAKEFPCDQPVLCHGDYLPSHIFATRDLKISSVIDFGEFQGGPPIIDFSQDTEGNWFDLEIFKAGYDDPELFDHRFARRLEMQNLATRMGYLAHHVRINHTDEIPGNVTALRGSLDILLRGQTS